MASKVLYFDKLPANLTEQKLRRLLLPIAAVDKIVLLRRHNALYSGFNPTTLEIARNSSIQALVEAADVNAAKQIVQTLAETPLLVGGSEENEAIAVSYSKNQELRDPNLARRSSRNHAQDAAAAKTNRILLVTVQNPTLPITTDFVREIFSSYGAVEKIVVFVKPVGVQVRGMHCLNCDRSAAALVGTELSILIIIETRSESNERATCGFSGMQQELVVKENNSRTKDFLHPMPSETNEKSDNTTVEDDSDVLGAPTAPHIGERDAVSPVLLVCNLRESVTCDNLFNLFSCYGNVTRVKRLHGKPLKMHLGAFHGGENAKVKLMFSPSSHIQALAELPTLDAATNVLAQAHNSSLGTKLLKIAFSKHSLH
ncbi:hypothetical protein BBJ28_00002260 [Nothophytophthora sp. Chile5]|nr:hypothetical protein BBJ28_00002260 [Nothophytophthora sp. Chile5]